MSTCTEGMSDRIDVRAHLEIRPDVDLEELVIRRQGLWRDESEVSTWINSRHSANARFHGLEILVEVVRLEKYLNSSNPFYYEAVHPSPAHRYFRPRGWSRLRLFPWHRRPGSHVPYDSLIELRAAYTPDAAWAVSGHPPSLSRRTGHPPVLTPPTQKLNAKNAVESMPQIHGAPKVPVSSIRVDQRFMATNPLSTLQKQFAYARLSRSCLPGSPSRRFRDAHHHGF